MFFLSFAAKCMKMYEGLWMERVRGILEMLLTGIWGIEGFQGQLLGFLG